jgi:hypothetical protein
MAEQNRAWVQIRDFQGLNLNIDPHDREPTQAVDQVNVTSTHEGQLRTRGGFRFVVFEDDA